MKIFAYGSNMCTARLQARVPSARPLGIATLPGHTLRFHKRGWRDGSGKCDAFATHDPGARPHTRPGTVAHLWGVIFHIAEAEKPDLDRVEGLGHGYEQARLPVTTPAGDSHHAWLYRAHPSAIDPDAVPFHWYHDLVLAGAREHDLPDDYVRRRIAGRTTRPDPDPARARRHRRLVTVTA